MSFEHVFVNDPTKPSVLYHRLMTFKPNDGNDDGDWGPFGDYRGGKLLGNRVCWHGHKLSPEGLPAMNP